MDAAFLAFAYVAGALAFFAPCSVGLLPAYVAFAVRPGADAAPPRFDRVALALAVAGVALLAVALATLGLAGLFPDVPAPSTGVAVALVPVGAGVASVGLARAGGARAAARGALFGLLASVGVLAVYLAIGLPVAFAARGLAPWFGALAAAIGVGLVVLGALQLAGRAPAVSFGLAAPDVASPRGFLLFGAAYGVASLSCTFPVFLGVVAGAFLTGGALDTLAAFAAFALGKATLLVAVTVVAVAGGRPAAQRLARAAPWLDRATGVALVVAGAYIAWYFGREAFL